MQPWHRRLRSELLLVIMENGHHASPNWNTRETLRFTVAGSHPARGKLAGGSRATKKWLVRELRTASHHLVPGFSGSRGLASHFLVHAIKKWKPQITEKIMKFGQPLQHPLCTFAFTCAVLSSSVTAMKDSFSPTCPHNTEKENKKQTHTQQSILNRC